jgi:Domain of unknown function (DUF5666)
MRRTSARTFILSVAVVAVAACGGSRSDQGSTEEMVRSMRGSVSDLQAPANPPTFTLTVPSAVAFHVALGPGVTLPSGLTNGSQVEVKTSSPTNPSNEIVATEVKLEDRAPGEDEHEFEVEGVVTSGNASSFMVGTQAVVTSDATRFLDGTPANVVPGAFVEAEGQLDAQGVLHAEKVEFKDREEADEVEVEGVVTSGNASSFMIGSQAVVTSDSTQFVGGTPANVVPGVRVEVEGTLDAQGVLHAEKVKFEDQEEQEVKVKGVVTSGNASSFMVGSQAVVTSPSTEFDHGSPASVVPGAFVEVEGTLDAQGVLHAEKVKFENSARWPRASGVPTDEGARPGERLATGLQPRIPHGPGVNHVRPHLEGHGHGRGA